MATPRTVVNGPTAAPAPPYGLLNAVDWRTAGDVHWKNGITWQETCPAAAGATVDPCYVGTIITKARTHTRAVYGATAFTVFAEIDCSAPGFWDDSDALIRQAFGVSEGAAVELTFWTGSIAATGGMQFPHLAANAQVLDDHGYILQLTATTVSGTAAPIVAGVATLEKALMRCLQGVGVLHVSPAVAEAMQANFLLIPRSGKLYTVNGNQVVVGIGYPGTSPAGAAPVADTEWIYGTGPLMGYRSDITIVGDTASHLVRDVNTEKIIAERTYLLAYDCCLFATLVRNTGT